MESNARILIVDDDPRNIRILYEILQDDFDLSSAENGEDALAVVKVLPPDIILLDIMMPGIDGYEVCSQLKDSEEYRNIKIILVSGKALTEERIKGYESGADDFVSKPFDIDEIHAKVSVFAKLKCMEEVNKLKTDFLRLVNHEMGTPLNHIISISDLLISQAGADKAVISSIRDISESAHALSKKVTKILYLANLKQSGINKKTNVNASNFISDVVQLLDNNSNPNVIKHSINEEINIFGDFDLLQVMFINVLETEISNSPCISYSMMDSSSDSPQPGINIIISSSRDELSPLQIEKYFDPFYIEDLMLHSEGLNINMAICSQIVAMHNGKISVSNSDSNRIEVMIWLPWGGAIEAKI